MNAKKELLGVLEAGMKIKCADIWLNDGSDIDTYIRLNVNYSDDDFLEFLKQLDFNYDDDYGSQKLFGTVWLSDKSWLSRGEYDGSEWWEYNKLPEIPSYLM
jgi:hypothetical protein